MKKISLLIATLLLCNAVVFAKHVDEKTAKTVALNFASTKTNLPNFRNAASFNLAYKASSTNTNETSSVPAENALFYVFNTNTTGFVIVAADDNIQPILAYSDEGSFDPNDMPPNARKWLDGYKEQISQIIENGIDANLKVKQEWNNYINNVGASNARSTSSVAKLLSTKWNQNGGGLISGFSYNAFCPGSAFNRSVTGCTATAMAQIMKYWNWPEVGAGFHSYTHNKYGTLTANFGNTKYAWASMNNNSSNLAVAMLMYHCGVSVDMNYGTQGSSGAVVRGDVDDDGSDECAQLAFSTYFGYRNVTSISRTSYSESQWIELLKDELNASQPILYVGANTKDAHAFVCDGYDENNLFHFNWGWGGQSDGYYSINNMVQGFNSNQYALIGIKPQAQTYTMALSKAVVPSSTTIQYGQSFSVNTNISNQSANTFTGSYCAAVFDDQYNFVSYIQTLTNRSLPAGSTYVNNLVFQTSGLANMFPGTYYVGIYYKPSRGNWIAAANRGSYTNFTKLTVTNAKDIELSSPMTISPSTTFTQGHSASVKVNVKNVGIGTYIGYYQLNLYKLDGTLAQTISTVNENLGLAAGHTYPSPGLRFSTSNITVAPGTYYLAVAHKTFWGFMTTELTGSSYYKNATRVIVQKNLPPDVYETNNTFSSAYKLPVRFTSNSLTVKTTGSTFHTETDNDYYKIVLPAGYKYTVNAQLQDAYNTTNGNNYTSDAMFSYSTDVDGVTWSQPYDIKSGTISINGPKTFWVRVVPYFAGDIGSYQLDLKLTRAPLRSAPSVGLEDKEFEPAMLDLYPNPAMDDVMLNVNEESVNSIVTIYDMLGNAVFADKINATQTSLNTKELANGIYSVVVNNGSTKTSSKLVVAH